MKFQYQMKILLTSVGMSALCSCSPWKQQTEGYIPLAPKTWCLKEDKVFKVGYNSHEYRNLNKELPYRDYIKKPLKLHEDLYVRFYQDITNPKKYELYGNDVKEYMIAQGLWNRKIEESWEKGGCLPVVPKGSTVVIHCVSGHYQYSLDSEKKRIKNPSNSVTALVEFFDPLTQQPVYGEYAWTSLKGIKKENTFTLHQYLKKAPWEPAETPELRIIQGAGYLTSKK